MIENGIKARVKGWSKDVMDGGRNDEMLRNSKEGRTGVTQNWMEGCSQGEKEARKIGGMKEQEMNGLTALKPPRS